MATKVKHNALRSEGQLIEQTAPLPNLPTELLLNILSRLKKGEVYCASLTCRSLFQAASCNYLWKSLFERDYPLRLPIPLDLPWNSHYRLADRAKSNLKNGTCTITTLNSHPMRITTLSGKGDYLFTASHDGTLKVRKKDPAGVLMDHQQFDQCEKGVFCLNSQEDRLLFPSAGNLNVLKKEADGNFREVQSLVGDGSRISQFNIDGDHCFLVSEDGALKRWRSDLEGTFQELAPLNGYYLASFAGEYFFAVSNDESLKVWKKDKTGTFEEFQTLEEPTPSNVRASWVRLEKGFLFLVSSDGKVKIWKKDAAGAFKDSQTLNATTIMNMFTAFHVKEDTAFCGLHNGHIFVLKQNSDGVFTIVQTFVDHNQRINAICSDGAYLFTGSTDGTAMVWERDGTGAYHLLQTLKEPGHEEGVTGLKIERDRFFTAYLDGSVKIWDYA